MTRHSPAGSRLRLAQLEGILKDLKRRSELREELKDYTFEAIAKRHLTSKNTVFYINEERKDAAPKGR